VEAAAPRVGGISVVSEREWSSLCSGSREKQIHHATEKGEAVT
jgi:hypothetical protein